MSLPMWLDEFEDYEDARLSAGDWPRLWTDFEGLRNWRMSFDFELDDSAYCNLYRGMSGLPTEGTTRGGLRYRLTEAPL